MATKKPGKKISTQMIFAAATVVVAGAVAILVGQFLTNSRKMETVVVATKDIKPFTPITSGELTTKQFAAMNVPPGTVTNPNQLVGKMVNTKIFTNYTIPDASLVQNQQGASALAAQITSYNNPLLRAFVVPASDLSAVGGTTQLKTGAHVDVIFSGTLKLVSKSSSGQQPQVQVAKTILTNIPVLSIVVGDNTSQGTNAGGKGQGVSGVTLLVTEDQAELLDFATNYGKINFALDPYNAQTDHSPGVSTNSFLTSQGFNVGK